MLNEVFATLLLSHPEYAPCSVATARERVGRMLEQVQAMVEEGCAVVGLLPPQNSKSFRPFTGKGPKCLYSILAPDTSLLPPCMQSLCGNQDLEVLFRPAFDQEQACGVQSEREKVLTLRRWLQHRLGQASRSGPADSPEYILLMFLKTEVDRIKSSFEIQQPGSQPSSLTDHPGTSGYYDILRRKLQAMHYWLGPPTWLLSNTMDTKSIQCLASWVSQYAGTAEHPVQVWERGDEKRLLTLLVGHRQPEGGEEEEEQGYYSHTSGQEVEGQLDNCPYHRGCRRQDLEKWKSR